MRADYYERTYGVPMSHLENLLAFQNGRCAICSTRWQECAAPKRSRYKSVFVQHLYVDHNHATGRVRGLLCNKCNVAIAFLRKDPSIVDAAAGYLRKHEENLDSSP